MIEDVRLLPARQQRRTEARMWVLRHRITSYARHNAQALGSLATEAQRTRAAATDLLATLEVDQLWKEA